MFKLKKEQGLKVKDILLFGLSQLRTWKWKLLAEDGTTWREVIMAKYRGGY